MKKLTNTEAELKQKRCLQKSVYIPCFYCKKLLKRYGVTIV